jgi:serine phosphatase RsbU (regulator of sigma subunit)
MFNRFSVKIFIPLFFLIQNLIASDTDSIKQLITNTRGTERVRLLIILVEEYERTDPKQAIQYADDALKILKYNADKELEAEVLYRKSWVFFYSNEFDSARFYIESINSIAEDSDLPIAYVMSNFLMAKIFRSEENFNEALKSLSIAEENNKTAKDRRHEIKILNEYGSIYRRLSRYDESLDHHLRALELLNNFEDRSELISTYTYLGIINDLKSNYDEALKYYHDALKLNKEENNTRGIAGNYHNIGILYQKIEKYNDALEYYNNALTYWKELKNNDGLASTLNSIGAVNELAGKYTEALNYYKQALKIWAETGSKSSLSIAYNNIGSIHEYLGNYNEAIFNLKRSINIRTELEDKYGLVSSMIILATVYNKKGERESALNIAKKSLEIAKEIESWPAMREAHILLTDIYEKSGLYKEALAEFKNYKTANDSILNSETHEVVAEMQEKYKTGEQKQQIEILQQEKEIDNLYRTILIAGLILITFILLLIYNRYRLKQRAHYALQKLHQTEIESAKLRMEAAETKSSILQINYEQKKKELDTARELQLSMLPSKLPEHPVVSIAALMQTATEVGGDYYDFYSGNDGSLTIAIGDATGHGAQAGIMVTAAKSLFNLLAGEKNITDILRASAKAIKKMQFTNLFMALGILRLHENEFELAGAGMPPAYIFRSETGNVEAVPLKGLPLGTVYDYPYQKMRVKLYPGDVVLLISDGFPELFNSEKTPLGFEKIPELLKESGLKQPEEIIKYFTDTAEKWLNGNKQQDDMTFVVMKVKNHIA